VTTSSNTCNLPAAIKISIVIPAFNEELLIGETLASIQRSGTAFTRRGWQIESIVCDNNSTDHTSEIAKSAGASVVFEPVNQIGRARNTGAAAASGDWLIFVDADSNPTEGLFEDVGKAIESGRVVAGGSTVKFDTSEYFAANVMTLVWNTLSRVAKLLAGSFIFVEAGAFREVGGFSSELFAAEEIELSNRLRTYTRKQGKKMVVLHEHPLLTSSRKMRLYKSSEHLRFVIRAALFPRKTLRNRDKCPNWYDGRRERARR
jgi:glycosyltransferase involved in cell wall biosynthesis